MNLFKIGSVVWALELASDMQTFSINQNGYFQQKLIIDLLFDEMQRNYLLHTFPKIVTLWPDTGTVFLSLFVLLIISNNSSIALHGAEGFSSLKFCL